MDRTLSRAILEIAVNELGNGEEGRNNAGFHINKYRRGRRPLGSGSWCASFIHWCYTQACYGLKRKPKIRYTASARKLTRELGKIGREVKHANAGDIVWFDRPGRGTHIAVCYDSDPFHFRTIDGNKGRFPAKVALHTHKHADPNILRIVRLD